MLPYFKKGVIMMVAWHVQLFRQDLGQSNNAYGNSCYFLQNFQRSDELTLNTKIKTSFR